MTTNALQTTNAYLESLVAEAERLQAFGLKVLPIDDKHPPIRDWQQLDFPADDIRQRLSSYGKPGIGVQMGIRVVDIEYDSDAQHAAALALFDGNPPIGPAFRTRHGQHWLFAWDDRLNACSVANVHIPCGDGEKLIVRVGANGLGTQSVFPPSKNREWLPGRSIYEIDLPQLPDAVIDRLIAAGRGGRPEPPSDVHAEALADMLTATKNMVDGNDGSKRLAVCGYRAVEWDLSNAQAVATVRQYETERPFPRDWTDTEILRRVADAERRTTRGKALMKPASLTDAGNAERFAAQHGTDLRYCHPSKHWLFFDGQRWREDDCGEVMRRAKATAKAIYREAEFADSSDEQKAVAKWAQSSQHASRLHAMQSLAQSEPGIAILPNQLDADPWLLNCPNGTIDLKTGELRPHRSEDFITKTTGVAYPIHVGSDPPLWRDFLEVIFSHDAELIAFVKRLLGYSLLGEVREHILPVFYGNGANGKSTLCEVVSEALGDYALKAPAGFLMTTRGELHPTRLADLHGRRFVLISETGDGRKLDEPLVKELTGGDTIRARRMHQDYWQFKPSHTCALVTNYKPTIHGVDQGIWRRLRLVPFDVSIPREQQDTELGAKLRRELPQILRWLVEGCREWDQNGLQEPAKVLMATEAYRVDSDSFSRWLAECCSVAPAATCKLTDAFDSYCEWGQTDEGVTLTRPKFTERLQNRGFTKLPKRNDGIHFCGFDLSKGDAGDDGDAALLFLS